MCRRAGVSIVLGVICGLETNSTEGETLRRIAGKVVMMLFNNDMTYASGPLQLSAGQDAGVEAVLHAMHDIFS